MKNLGLISDDLGLYSAKPSAGNRAEDRRAKRAEAAALDADPRIVNSEGGSFDAYAGRHIFANSRGFIGRIQTSYCAVSAVPVARDGESMERDHWSHSARRFADLESPEHIGRTAARRALRRLNPVKVETQKVPVVFEPGMARSLLDSVCDAVHGMSVYRNESFLAGRLGEKVAARASPLLTTERCPGSLGRRLSTMRGCGRGALR